MGAKDVGDFEGGTRHARLLRGMQVLQRAVRERLPMCWRIVICGRCASGLRWA